MPLRHESSLLIRPRGVQLAVGPMQNYQTQTLPHSSPESHRPPLISQACQRRRPRPIFQACQMSLLELRESCRTYRSSQLQVNLQMGARGKAIPRGAWMQSRLCPNTARFIISQLLTTSEARPIRGDLAKPNRCQRYGIRRFWPRSAKAPKGTCNGSNATIPPSALPRNGTPAKLTFSSRFMRKDLLLRGCIRRHWDVMYTCLCLR